MCSTYFTSDYCRYSIIMAMANTGFSEIDVPDSTSPLHADCSNDCISVLTGQGSFYAPVYKIAFRSTPTFDGFFG